MTSRVISPRGELAGAFVVRDPHWREKIFYGGVLLLLAPPIGWPVALGYRKELIARLLQGTNPLLPEWQGQLARYFLEGLKAMGVIFGYLAPLYAAFFVLLLSFGVTPNVYWGYMVLFFLLVPIFSTLSLPLAVVYWSFVSDTPRLPLPCALLLLALFTAVIFFIPAGFLQVSKSGRYRSAFDLKAAFSTIQRNFSRYVRAWYHSTLMSLSGHLALPFSPWGVVWCYLAIIFEFNQILANSNEIDSRGSWFERLQGDDRILVEPTRQPYVLKCSNIVEPNNRHCYFLKLGPILVPLPELVCRRLSLEVRTWS